MPARPPSRIVVLVSGTGTLLQALIDAEERIEDSGASADFPARIVAVGSDRIDAPALARAGRRESFVLAPDDYAQRLEWDRALTTKLAEFQPDLIVCAGFMRVLGSDTVAAFEGRIINSHPALLPSFPGSHGVRDALAYGVHVTGATVHLVDSGVDTGPILAQEAVEIAPTDDEATLHERIKMVERRLLVDTVAGFALSPPVVVGRSVRR